MLPPETLANDPLPRILKVIAAQMTEQVLIALPCLQVIFVAQCFHHPRVVYFAPFREAAVQARRPPYLPKSCFYFRGS